MPKKSSVDPRRIVGTREAALPATVKPSLATLVDEAPAGRGIG
jgi:hypothetical protein